MSLIVRLSLGGAAVIALLALGWYVSTQRTPQILTIVDHTQPWLWVKSKNSLEQLKAFPIFQKWLESSQVDGTDFLALDDSASNEAVVTKLLTSWADEDGLVFQLTPQPLIVLPFKNPQTAKTVLKRLQETTSSIWQVNRYRQLVVLSAASPSVHTSSQVPVIHFDSLWHFRIADLPINLWVSDADGVHFSLPGNIPSGSTSSLASYDWDSLKPLGWQAGKDIVRLINTIAPAIPSLKNSDWANIGLDKDQLAMVSSSQDYVVLWFGKSEGLLAVPAIALVVDTTGKNKAVEQAVTNWQKRFELLPGRFPQVAQVTLPDGSLSSELFVATHGTYQFRTTNLNNLTVSSLEVPSTTSTHFPILGFHFTNMGHYAVITNDLNLLLPIQKILSGSPLHPPLTQAKIFNPQAVSDSVSSSLSALGFSWEPQHYLPARPTIFYWQSTSQGIIGSLTTQ